MIIRILQRMKLRYREVKQLAEGHKASKSPKISGVKESGSESVILTIWLLNTYAIFNPGNQGGDRGHIQMALTSHLCYFQRLREEWKDKNMNETLILPGGR